MGHLPDRTSTAAQPLNFPMDITQTIALTMGVAWASGINLYATILVLGYMGMTGNIDLPPDLEILADPMVMVAAGLIYAIELFAHKVPGVDTGWDAHSNIEKSHGESIAKVDKPITGLIKDLKRRGLLDSTLIAYRLAEDARVRLPAIVNQDGFYLSFTREPVEIPEQDTMESFLPPFDPENMQFRASAPVSQAVAVLGGVPYSYFRYETHLASLQALEVYDEVAAEFEQNTGRANPAVECYRTEDADFVFVMLGAFATKARQAVDQLREAGWPIGLVRPRLFRPFPEEKIREALKGKQGGAVIDQNISFGRGGVLHPGAVIGGDGIGPEVIASARRVLDVVAERYAHTFTYREELVGGAAIDAGAGGLRAEHQHGEDREDCAEDEHDAAVGFALEPAPGPAGGQGSLPGLQEVGLTLAVGGQEDVVDAGRLVPVGLSEPGHGQTGSRPAPRPCRHRRNSSGSSPGDWPP